MPQFREPIFHDRQEINVTGPVVLPTSALFTDIPGATFTTKDLGSPGTYMAIVVAEIEHSSNNSLVEIRVTIDGTPEAEKEFNFGPSSRDNPVILTALGFMTGVESGAVLQIQWRTNLNSATLNNLDVIVDGIPDIRIVS